MEKKIKINKLKKKIRPDNKVRARLDLNTVMGWTRHHVSPSLDMDNHKMAQIQLVLKRK